MLDFSKISLFKKYETNGNIKRYPIDTLIVYDARLFFATRDTTGKSIPSQSSTIWKEVTYPFRIVTSETEPSGIKILGDRWFNPMTNIEYTYTKNNNDYVWLSN